MDEAQVRRTGESEDVGREQGKEMNYRQEEPQLGSLRVENTGLLKERQLVWLGGEAREVGGGWVWTTGVPWKNISALFSRLVGGCWRFERVTIRAVLPGSEFRW